MLTDYWVISLLISELLALVLLFPATWFSIRILRYWNSEKSDALQISLEQQSYLVSAIIQLVLFFQLLNLVAFLYTVNQHLPPLIKGAMCATGTLSINAYGYPVLYLKIFGVLLYLVFLMLNYWDNQSPAYPLTPQKYIWVLPIFLWVLTDWLLMSYYFSQLSPDIIATCCSVNFSTSSKNTHILGLGSHLNVVFIFFIGSFAGLSLGWIFLMVRKKMQKIGSLLLFLGSIVYIGTAVYSLKFFFVKYIYGLPTHTCLFDIFFGQYYYIGYWLFGLYYLLLSSALFLLLSQFFASKILKTTVMLRWHYWGFGALQGSFWTVMAYWYFWQGTL